MAEIDAARRAVERTMLIIENCESLLDGAWIFSFNHVEEKNGLSVSSDGV